MIRSEQKFKVLVQKGNDLIAILDSEENYTVVSETSNAILGIPVAEMLEKTFSNPFILKIESDSCTDFEN